jgi:twitching motility protein PilT
MIAIISILTKRRTALNLTGLRFKEVPGLRGPTSVIMDDVNERTQLGQRLYQLSQQSGISDFFITPWEPLAYKFNGHVVYDSLVYQPTMAFDIKPGHWDYAMSFGGRRYRVNGCVTKGRMRWVMRLLPSKIPHPSEISIPPGAVKAIMEAKNGLFLICGPTGSGKSTTIASLLKYRAERKKEHLLTFEDPIEFVYPDDLETIVTQREMGGDETDFGGALHAALRQAPDVILIGEIRDGETAEIAMQAAETGHVVVATLHTNSASQTVSRFLKLISAERMESAQETLADILRMVLCQRLLADPVKSKRFAIHEMLLQYDSVSNLIRTGQFKKLDQELETGWKRGLMSFQRCIEQRQAEGWTPPNAHLRTSGFTPQEVEEFFYREQAQDLARDTSGRAAEASAGNAAPPQFAGLASHHPAAL